MLESAGAIAANHSNFRNKTASRIEPVKVINWLALHVARVFTVAQRRRDARHNGCRNAPHIAYGRTVNMAGENSDDSAGMLQCLLQPQHGLLGREVK